LILDTPDIVPTPVPGFGAIQADIAAAGPVELLSIPEPTTALLLIVGAASWFLGRLSVSSRPIP